MSAVAALVARRTAAGASARRSRSRGQSLVEFAFVLPVIAFMVFAFVDVGRAVFAFNTVTNAAREAARVAAVSQLDPVSGPWKCQSDRPVESLVSPNWTFRGCAMTAGAALGVKGTDVTVAYATPPGTTLECSPNLNVGCLVTITVHANFVPITPVAGQVIGAIAMSSTQQLPIERLLP